MSFDLFFVPRSPPFATLHDEGYVPTATQRRARGKVVDALLARHEDASLSGDAMRGSLDGISGSMLLEPGYIHWSLTGIDAGDLDAMQDMVDWFKSHGLVCEDVQESGFGNRYAGQVEVLESIEALVGSQLLGVRFDRDAATALILDWTLPDGRTARQRLAHLGHVELPPLAPLVAARVCAVRVERTPRHDDIVMNFDSGDVLQMRGCVPDRITVRGRRATSASPAAAARFRSTANAAPTSPPPPTQAQATPNPLALSWSTAWDMPAYSIAGEDFDDRVMSRLADVDSDRYMHMPSSAAVSALATALMLSARALDPHRVQRLANRAQAVLQPATTAMRGIDPDVAPSELGAAYHLGLLAHLAGPSLPERDVLTLAGRRAIELLTARKRSLDSLIEAPLRRAAFGALLAQDAALLDHLIALVPRSIQSKPLWAFMKRVAGAAEPCAREGGTGFHVPGAGLHAEFEALFALHRQPWLPEPEIRDALDVPPLLANYAFAWAKLSLFCDEPVVVTNWATMRALMLREPSIEPR